MADVSITIRKNDGGSDTSIILNGSVDDAALEPVLNKISNLLSASMTASAPTTV
jgi:hypothetical protein